VERSYHRVGIDSVLSVQKEGGIEEDEPSDDENQSQEAYQVFGYEVVHEAHEDNIRAGRSGRTFVVKKVYVSQDQYKAC